MSKLFWKSLLVSPIGIIGATLMLSSAAIAAENLTSAEKVQPQTTATQEIAAAETTTESVSATAVELPELAATEADSSVPATELNFATPEVESVAQVPPATNSGENYQDILNQLDRYGNEGRGDSLDQITNVNQLRDVSPSDWAYEALRNLVNNYGCIQGYPDGTYRGNRALTRYEFAAGLNACLEVLAARIREGGGGTTTPPVTEEDLLVLRRLIQEFEAELATLGTRVDDLEARVAFLEDNQFSTTTKLAGEVVVAITDTFYDDRSDNNTILGDRVRLDFVTSFTGRDALHTRLAAGNAATFDVEGTNSATATQTFNLGNTGGNNVVIDWSAYYFPLFGDSQAYLAAAGGIHSDYAPTLNPYFEDYDGGDGALSTFASENPIYRIGGGAGAAISFAFSPLESILGPSTVTLGYLSGTADNPGDDNGLFNGSYAALGQINFNISDRFGLGLTYVHGYHNSFSAIFGGGAPGDASRFEYNSGIVGTPAANNIGLDSPVVTNSYGAEVAFRLSDGISISGFATYTDAIIIGRGDGEIWTYGGGIAFPDFIKEGSILGFFAGVQPYVHDLDGRGLSDGGEDLPLHIEGFYKYQLTDNISFTPGVIWQRAPNEEERDVLIGTIRTTFNF
ncbi:MAG: iron uptake porin [Oscillatoria sp. PMC 1068.18]|nr:iron uptake porin [Oscillatoria sp. PMC 1076.18]MEC4991623.1 iron uptake porin [Oscillatoria sp. PMC 1068.18]